MNHQTAECKKERVDFSCCDCSNSSQQEATSSKHPDCSGDNINVNSSFCRDSFRDCALIEIIHLHDCLRGALHRLEADMSALCNSICCGQAENDPILLERKVNSRLQVIWSVFRAHSTAEDEFIWPALEKKKDVTVTTCCSSSSNKAPKDCKHPETKLVVGMEEYEEDHENEEKMFSEMDRLLSQLRSHLQKTGTEKSKRSNEDSSSLNTMTRALCSLTHSLSTHLHHHLTKEETQCMPLVAQHLSNTEIEDLVGQIMGQRSADTIAQILSMAVQNLPQSERVEMVGYMQNAMAGTFFDKWLSMSGYWAGNKDTKGAGVEQEKEEVMYKFAPADDEGDQEPALPAVAPAAAPQDNGPQVAVAAAGIPAVVIEDDADSRESDRKRPPSAALSDDSDDGTTRSSTKPRLSISDVVDQALRSKNHDEATSEDDLHKYIRAIATNASLSSKDKNAIIQGLRDSVWRSNQRKRQKQAASSSPPTVVNQATGTATALSLVGTTPVTTFAPTAAAAAASNRRATPPSRYYKNQGGKLKLVYCQEIKESSSDSAQPPLFSATELAPTYHDGAAGTVLGCPHYSRACKLRHPVSGRLYTCRLCCQQERELNATTDEPLDRYQVQEVFCMTCHSLQPASDRCINVECANRNQPFAKYFCRICHLYDDDKDKSIFHCPYCNCCRLGQGLGIDFRHCMVRSFVIECSRLGFLLCWQIALFSPYCFLVHSALQCLCFTLRLGSPMYSSEASRELPDLS